LEPVSHDSKIVNKEVASLESDEYWVVNGRLLMKFEKKMVEEYASSQEDDK
jgi:hypothetical protein